MSTERCIRVQSLAAQLVHSRPGSVLFSDLSLDKEASPNRWCKTRAGGGLPRTGRSKVEGYWPKLTIKYKPAYFGKDWFPTQDEAQFFILDLACDYYEAAHSKAA